MIWIREDAIWEFREIVYTIDGRPVLRSYRLSIYGDTYRTYTFDIDLRRTESTITGEPNA